MNAAVSSLMILLALFGSNNCQETCNFSTDITPGEIYEVKNSEHPDTYVGGLSCQWVFKTRWDYRVKIQCNDVRMPSDRYCQGDRLEIRDGVGRNVARYCYPFVYISQSSRLSIIFRSFPNPLLGRYQCMVWAIKLNTCECGRRNAPKIHDGEETGMNEYPSAVALIDITKSGELICGGTIINEKQILTAAHCVHDREDSSIGIYAGGHYLTNAQATPGADVFLIEKKKVHWSYAGPNKGLDVALVTIRKRFTFNETVSPVCLPFQRPLDSFLHTRTDILGWGAESIIGGPLNRLMRATVNVVPRTQCSSFHGVSTNSHICTWDQSKDFCGWDSGGPLLIQTETTRKLIQIGIMNKGPACGEGQTSLSVRVGPLIPWIVAHTTPDIGYCQEE